MVAWRDWEPLYGEILRDFGYSRADDEIARDELATLAAECATLDDRALGDLFGDADVLVVGPATGAVPEPGPREVLVATDAATLRVLERGLVPDVVVTDLDGEVAAQEEASRRGAVLVVHAHGDNRSSLARWVPRFSGPIVATTQAEPVVGVRNFGGFTDGDRAVLLADHFGARRIALAGFDFESPVPKAGRDAAVKLRKLAWAKRLVALSRAPVSDAAARGR